MIHLEMEMLISFGFYVHVCKPHGFLLPYMERLEMNNIMQHAWNCCNDRFGTIFSFFLNFNSFSTIAVVRFNAQTVAAGSIYYAAHTNKVI